MAYSPDQRVWGVMVVRVGVSEAFGAARMSERLHWSQPDAVKEAEMFARELRAASTIHWEVLDDTSVIGRFNDYAIVVRSLLLPLGEPPT